jgi:uncharacterized protein YjbI with pentapeptide repeats
VAAYLWLVFGAVFAAGLGLLTLGVWVGFGADSKKRQLAVQLATDTGVAFVTGAVLGIVVYRATDHLERSIFNAQENFEEDRFARDIRRDNVRFVREVAIQPEAIQKPFAGLDLRDAELSALNLSGANLSGANLSDAVLDSANLSDALLTRAFLVNADLSDTDLINANLGGANLTDADLIGATPVNANLTDANLSGADLSGADLIGAILVNANLNDANLGPSTEYSGEHPPV